MARFDKYDPISGGFRAPLAADWIPADLEVPFGVGLNASGQVVKGSGNTGVLGVMTLTKVRYANEIVDVMTDGEVVECTGLTAGTVYFSAATGAISTLNTGVRVGATVEASRLVVRAAR